MQPRDRLPCAKPASCCQARSPCLPPAVLLLRMLRALRSHHRCSCSCTQERRSWQPTGWVQLNCSRLLRLARQVQYSEAECAGREAGSPAPEVRATTPLHSAALGSGGGGRRGGEALSRMCKGGCVRVVQCNSTQTRIGKKYNSQSSGCQEPMQAPVPGALQLPEPSHQLTSPTSPR